MFEEEFDPYGVAGGCLDAARREVAVELEQLTHEGHADLDQ
jgi:hypothetical protein